MTVHPAPRWYCSWVEAGRRVHLETDRLPPRIWPPDGKPPEGIRERMRVARHEWGGLP